MVKPHALVMFSGGLDSRLVVKLLQNQGINVTAVMFKLPFGGGCCNDEMCSFKFSQLEGVKLEIIDCTKGELLKEYLEMLKNPKYGTGAGINPCKDCRIFILKHAKALLKKFKADFIATGEVLNERPMSQRKKSMTLIEEESGLEGLLLRPLSAKLLPETEIEKKGLVDRTKLLDIQGKNRTPQITLAKKYKISYPQPGGGCILCEKNYVKKINDFLKHTSTDKITIEHLKTLRGFRHFRDKGKIVLGRNHGQNTLLVELNKKLNQNIILPPQENPGPVVIYEDKKDKELAEKLSEAYSKKDKKQISDLTKKFGI